MMENTRFVGLINTILSKKESNGLPLDSYLNHPLQRICKISLLLKCIVDTASNSQDYESYLKAYQIAEAVSFFFEFVKNLLISEYCFAAAGYTSPATALSVVGSSFDVSGSS